MAFDLTVQESYARALLAAARQTDRFEAVCQDARDLVEFMMQAANGRARVFLESPQVRDEDKHRLVERLFGSQVDALLVNFMKLMVDNRRTQYIGPALRRFCALIDAEQNIYPGIIETPMALTPDEQQEMQTRLERYTGARLRMRYRVNPDLIGGVVFKYRDLLADNTLRSSLNELRGRLDGFRLRLDPPPVES